MSVQVKAEPDGPASAHSNLVDMMMIDEDDEEHDAEEEVVREIDVFLSPELAKQIYLLQFPLQRQKHRDKSGPHAARIKSRHCMVELDYPTRSADGNEQEYNGQFHMPTRTYASQTIPVSTHMALGKFVANPNGGSDAAGLHLVPLSRITQMRPSFHHVNEATLQTSATSEDEHETPDVTLDSSSSRKPLTFQKKESERAALARKSSYGYKKTSEESESWLSLDVHRTGSLEYQQAMLKIPCPNPDQSLLLTSNEKNKHTAEDIVDVTESSSKSSGTAGSSYIQSLNYLPRRANAVGIDKTEQDVDSSNNEANSVAVVVGKLVELLQQGWPIPFSLLRNQFDASISNETLFAALNNCAFLVRGNFLLQSRFLPFAPAISHARTFILFLLQTLEVVHRSRLEHVYKGDDVVTPEVIIMLLQQVAKKTGQGWKLKVDDDESFAKSFPSAVPIYLDFWGSQVRRFGPLLERYRQNPELKINSNNNN